MIHPFLDKKLINQRRKNIKNLIGLSLFFALAITGFLTWTGHLFNFLGRPVWEAEKVVTDRLYNVNYLYRSKAAISKENHNLIDEVSYLRASMSDYQILKNENEKLKEILGRLSEKNNFILGNILTKPSHSLYDTVIIDIGTSLNIKQGDIVYADGSVPIGFISQVYDKTALVTLYSSPGQKTEGFIEANNASVELTGRGGGNFEMIIPVELNIETGAIIYLPGSRSLVLAIIDETISAPTDPFKKVILSSPVNIQNLKWVQVKKD